MKLVLTTVFDATEPDAAKENVAFHLNAGVDLVLAAVRDDEAESALRSLGDQVLVERTGGGGTEVRTQLARRAATEHGADLILVSKFASHAALDGYQSHPEHLALVPFVVEAQSERRVVDYETLR